MRKVFVSLIIFACVEMYLSQNMNNIKLDPFDGLEKFSFEDFDKPPQTENPLPCHAPNMKCLRGIKGYKPVCGVEDKLRLINFNSKCQIYMKNCLARPSNDTTAYGVASKYDSIFYNGKEHTCHYYFKKAEGIEDPLKLYYKIGYTKEYVVNNKYDNEF